MNRTFSFNGHGINSIFFPFVALAVIFFAIVVLVIDFINGREMPSISTSREGGKLRVKYEVYR